MTALLLAVLLCGQPDTLLVEILLSETQERILVEAVLDADSTLHLPARPIGELLGVTFPAPWITVAALQRAYPTVRFAWSPRELRLYVLDDLRVFPASRRANQRLLARHQLSFGLPAWSGPFASVAADERGAYVTDVGYSWRSKVSLALRESSRFGAAWGVTVAPSARLNVSYADGARVPPTASVRLAAGPAWAFATWTPRGWETDALVHVGRVSLFASTRDVFAVTINATPVGVQVGWTGQHTTARLTYGPAQPSPFGVPMVP